MHHLFRSPSGFLPKGKAKKYPKNFTKSFLTGGGGVGVGG